MQINYNFKNRDDKPGTLGAIKPGKCFSFDQPGEPGNIFMRLEESQDQNSRIAFVGLRLGRVFYEMPNFSVLEQTVCLEVD